MTLIRWSNSALAVLIFASIASAQVDTNCLIGEKAGVCKPLKDCAAARDDVRNGITPTRCQSEGGLVVCCANDDTTLKPPTCSPVPDEMVLIKKDGRKARDACIDWHELIHPCVGNAGGGSHRKNVCGHVSAPLTIGSTKANPTEFPHMAHLGFGSNKKNITWGCGGTLISYQWVLTAATAAQCFWSRNGGEVAVVRLGETNTSKPALPDDVYDVIEIHKHPSFSFRFKYDDIALLKLDRKVKFGESVIPACLHVGEVIDDDKAIVSGWGLKVTNDRNLNSEPILKATLEKFTHEECKVLFKPNRKSPEGIRNNTQSCFGYHSQIEDGCEGNSGSPIQIYNTYVECMYTIIGITSYGPSCGSVGYPVVHTRVEAYIPWIESIVWP